MADSTWSTPIPQERMFWDDFDADYIFDFAGRLSEIGTFELGFKPGGSKAAHRAAEMIAEEMRFLGMHNVVKEPFPVYAWDFAGARIKMGEWGSIPACAFPPTPGTPPEGLSAELVDVGGGTARDYVGVDVRDKIAFIRYDANRLPWMGTMGYEAELHGARALVFYYQNGYAQHESGEALNIHNGTARETIPILQISINDGKRIADRLAKDHPLEATIHSEVEANPRGTGYNVIGVIPGRLTERFIILGSHYDAWFQGYWDNAVGVGAILAIAKTLLKSGYQPEHTMIFVATDAEEFGAADTQFDWLIGCQNLLEAHPEWHGKVSAAFNIDTLPPVGTKQPGFIGAPELLPFLRAFAETYRPKSFQETSVEIVEQVTAWTETLTYSYFGIPPLQPSFRLDEIKETIYHTQFDGVSIVDRAMGAETVQVYGSILVRLDRQTILPYGFDERGRSLRATIENPPLDEVPEELAELQRALDRFEGRVAELKRSFIEMDESRLMSVRDKINDGLRQLATHLVENINYLNGAEADDALPLHVFYDQDLRALEYAIDYLEQGEGEKALQALTDSEKGLQGASWALEMSYPAWYRHALDGSNQGRDDLYWGKHRTARVTDIWGTLHIIHDKLAHGVSDFNPASHVLRQKRQDVAEAYLEAVRDLTDIMDIASAMIPINELGEL